MESTPTTLLISLDALIFHVGEDDNEGDEEEEEEKEADEEFPVDVEAATKARDVLVAFRRKDLSS